MVMATFSISLIQIAFNPTDLGGGGGIYIRDENRSGSSGLKQFINPPNLFLGEKIEIEPNHSTRRLWVVAGCGRVG